jgi:mRNA interferase MazF
MPSDIAFLAFGDIVLVPFPFTNQTASKQRPAVIVSSALYNSSRPDIIIMAVSSQIRTTGSYGDVWISQWQAAGLIKPSAVKPVMATLEQRLILRRLGTLAPDDQHALRDVLGTLIG